MIKLRYKQISDYVQEQIANGVWKSGEPIPTVKELTGHFGVSHLTVLRAYRKLREDGCVSLRGKRYVVGSESVAPQEAVERTATIGLLCRPLWARNPEDNFFNDIHYGIQDECCLSGCSYLTPPEVRALNQTITPAPSAFDNLVAAALRMAPAVDGFLYDERIPDACLERITRQTGKPGILVGRTTALELDSVSPDWRGAMRLLGHSAWRLGYRKFVFAISMRGVFHEKTKRQALMEFIAEHGLTEADYRITEDFCRIRYDEAREQLIPAMREMLASGERVAVLCVNDTFTRPAMEMIREEFHLQPGKDFGIGGVGGLSVSLEDPKIATVEAGPEEIGRMAVKNLLIRISGGNTLKAVNHSPEATFRWSESL